MVVVVVVVEDGDVAGSGGGGCSSVGRVIMVVVVVVVLVVVDLTSCLFAFCLYRIVQQQTGHMVAASLRYFITFPENVQEGESKVFEIVFQFNKLFLLGAVLRRQLSKLKTDLL